MIKSIFITILILFLSINLSQEKLTGIVETDKGKVRGEIVKTVQNLSIEYSAFRGIPYAKPPIGQLRFQPPVEADPWSKTLIATKEAPICPQIIELTGEYGGIESCLYLNVYSPKTSFNISDNELFAVMVWIHSGTFIAGESKSRTFGPDFLIAENVVVVIMNYRVGCLGFLSLDIPEVTGNMGLKDQVLALKWVKKNIKNFGGDPNKVMLFGQSAGSVCTSLHQLSPASNGLFRAAILMSGSPLNKWGFQSLSSAVSLAFKTGKLLGNDNNDKKKLFSLLQKVPVKEIINAEYSETGVKLGLPGFRPTYENPSFAKDIFLSKCPFRCYKSGNFFKIPIIIGFTNSETLAASSVFGDFYSKITSGRTISELFNLPNSTLLSEVNSVLASVDKGIKHLSESLLSQSVNITTDSAFIAGIDLTQKYLAKGFAPVYYYRNSFDYKESRHRMLGADVRGTAHADDVALIFWQPELNQTVDPSLHVVIQRKKMVKLWTNFAKYLNPTPDGISDDLLNIVWTPSEKSGMHLNIGNEKLTMEPQSTSITVKITQLISKLFDGYFTGCPFF